jgi:hypothetical protein
MTLSAITTRAYQLKTGIGHDTGYTTKTQIFSFGGNPFCLQIYT